MKTPMNGRVIFFGRAPDKDLEIYAKRCIDAWTTKHSGETGSTNYAVRLFFSPPLSNPITKWVGCEIELLSEGKTYAGRVVAADPYEAVSQTVKALKLKKEALEIEAGFLPAGTPAMSKLKM
jgi:hypothetical protein